jgi:hypothetical protein
MDLGPLRALALELNFSAHGVLAVVTRPAPYNDSIVTRCIWLTTETPGVPASTDFQRGDPRRVLVLRRTDVPAVPRNTVINAPEKAGDADQNWRVDGIDRIEADQIRVIVVAVE